MVKQVINSRLRGKPGPGKQCKWDDPEQYPLKRYADWCAHPELSKTTRLLFLNEMNGRLTGDCL
jgi:hypothetical protein